MLKEVVKLLSLQKKNLQDDGVKKNFNQKIIIQVNLKKKHYKEFNTRVSENWKQGKIDSDAKFIYIDIAQLGFTDSIKNKYMKHIKYLEQMNKQL